MNGEIEKMKSMQSQIMSCVQGQLGDLKNADAKQLGQAIDMIKDFAEAIYYTTITDSMEKADKETERSVNNINYYTTPLMGGKMYPGDYYRDMERGNGYMYYPSVNGSVSTTSGMNGGHSTGNNGSMNYYTEYMEPRMGEMRDPREGRAGRRRRMYMEGKEMHKDTNSQLKELEAYLQELSTDIAEMIKDASPEERATLHQKMTTLANKIS